MGDDIYDIDPFKTKRDRIPDDIVDLINQVMTLQVWKFEIFRRELSELFCDDEMGDEY
jgi:hypothetical protein